MRRVARVAQAAAPFVATLECRIASVSDRARALCWSACMVAYAACIAASKLDDGGYGSGSGSGQGSGSGTYTDSDGFTHGTNEF